MSIEILTNCITLPSSSSKRDFQRRENILTGLKKFVKQINTSRYGDYRITDCYFFQDSPFKRANYMRVICEILSQIEHQHMTNY